MPAASTIEDFAAVSADPMTSGILIVLREEILNAVASRTMERDKAQAQNGWKLAKEKIESGKYNIVILDELTHAINHGFIDLEEVLHTLKKKPEMLHVIITGRNAPKELVEMADLVTEMKLVKHPYEMGVVAQHGIEF